MKLLLYRWGANNEDVLHKNLIRSGHEVTECSIKCKNYTQDVELAAAMIEQIHRDKAEGIISFNYFPIVSMVADVTKTTYYSWVYDCPHFTLYARTAGMACNRIGVFDRSIADSFRSRGINTVFHLPLAADTEYWDGITGEGINEASKGKAGFGRFGSDVSFVGSLYTDEHNYFDMIYPIAGEKELSAGNKSTVMDVIDNWCFDYDSSVSYVERLNKSGDLEYAESQMSEMGLMLGADYEFEPEDIVIPSVFEKKVTILERKRLLEAVSKIDGVDFKLYTNSKTGIPKCVSSKGTVDYKKEMPLVFNRNRINLNISLRSIRSGIPLRVIDIMSCGGFVLSNYQQEIADYFKEGEEIAMFRSEDEAIEKIRYYLEHENERAAVAWAGYEAVKERFGYESLLTDLLTR